MEVLTGRMHYEMDLYKMALARFQQLKRQLIVFDRVPTFMDTIGHQVTV